MSGLSTGSIITLNTCGFLPAIRRLNHHEHDAGDKAAVAHQVRHAHLQSRHLKTDGEDLYVTA